MSGERDRLVLARALTNAFLDAGAWEHDALVAAGDRILAPAPAWLPELTHHVLASFPAAPQRRPELLVARIGALLPALGAVRLDAPPPRPPRPPRPRFLDEVPRFDGAAGLARWLRLSEAELAWYADVRGLERSAGDEALRHYRYGWRRRADGDRVRVIERPKAELKDVQRLLLQGLLERIPPHLAAHGFVRGRSALSHAGAHVGRRVVIGFDLEDFFATVHVGRVRAVFAAAGYDRELTRLLAGLSTNAVPPRAWVRIPRPTRPVALPRHHQLGRRLAFAHLPQGAPTSPALANLVARRLDLRLTGLGARWDARYTRYADDLTFSGGERLLRDARRFRAAVRDVVHAEGFALNHAKSHLTTSAGRQVVTGIVVNEKPNLARADYDRLKALLHNCLRDGPAAHDPGGPDFRAHLQGRVAWAAALQPERGARLQARLDQVDWTPRGP